MLIFDNETNGLLDKLDRLHCVTFFDTDDGLFYRGSPGGVGTVGPGQVRITIEEAVRRVQEADEIVGHNVINFDIPAMRKVYPWFKPRGRVRDTVLLSRLIYTDLKDRDFALRKKQQRRKDKYINDGQHELAEACLVFPGNLCGLHSLESWGYRLGKWKGDYAQMMEAQGLDPWAEWSQEMDDYCLQDVIVTVALWEKLKSKEYSEEAIELEHDVAAIVERQSRYGFLFDAEAARKLEGELMILRTQLESELRSAFPPWTTTKKVPFTPKRDNKTKGYKAGVPTVKVTVTENVFNPASRAHVSYNLRKKYGWKPTEFTDTGQPKVDEKVLKGLPWPEAKELSRLFLVDKRLGQLSNGKQNWLDAAKATGRVHGRVTTNGAVTGRMTHSSPNVAQVPKVKAAKTGILYGEMGGWGWECRSLFCVPKSKRQVGADASGLELRCLAHYMGKWDDGAYAKVILEGDIHSVNQEAAGLPTRDNAKTFIYAFLYGAGDEKIGSIVGKGKQAGAGLKKKFLSGLPALGRLLRAIENQVREKGYLRGLDGRILHIRSSHAALNTLLQSAGAVVMKKALVLLDRRLQARGYVPGVDYEFVANVHDEWQIECNPEIAEEVGEAARAAIRSAGEYFKFRCPLDGEFKVGTCWAETH